MSPEAGYSDPTGSRRSECQYAGAQFRVLSDPGQQAAPRGRANAPSVGGSGRERTATLNIWLAAAQEAFAHCSGSHAGERLARPRPEALRTAQ
jgi:hypothetical protein